MTMAKNNDTLRYRVEQLEKRYEKLDTKLDEIMTNHLPHIHKEIIKMRTEQRLVGALIIGSGIIAFVIQRVLG